MSARSDTSSRPGGGSIDLPTLVLTAVASAAAAYTCSKIWAPGTLASAAFTPVLVAILKEALARPTRVVTRVVPVRGAVRSTPPPSSPTYAPPEPEPPPPTGPVAQQGEIAYHSTGPSPRRWRLAIVTGLLGFVVAALVLTVPEIVAGDSASGGGGTTLFGGQSEDRKAPTKTTTAPARTVTVPVPAATAPAPVEPTGRVPPAETTTGPAAPTTTAPAAPMSPVPTVTEPPPTQPPG
ncbi:MAG: hypothetical protein ACR2H2_12465 [Solirubrobacteraceae bacterium]